MASTSDIRNGLCLNFNGDVYTVVSFLHVKPGKGNAFVRTKMKSMKTGRVIENTFPAGHKIDDVRVERREFQYLYHDDFGFHFMDENTYEQITLEKDMIGSTDFLKEGGKIEVLFDGTKDIPLRLEMPKFLEFEITYTEPGIKGDTATNASKPAKIETGAEIRVPLFINTGDIIKIDSASGSYVERIKK